MCLPWQSSFSPPNWNLNLCTKTWNLMQAINANHPHILDVWNYKKTMQGWITHNFHDCCQWVPSKKLGFGKAWNQLMNDVQCVQLTHQTPYTWCMHHGKGSNHDLKHVHVLGMPTYASKHVWNTPQNLHHHLYPITQLIFEEIRIIVCEHSFG